MAEPELAAGCGRVRVVASYEVSTRRYPVRASTVEKTSAHCGCHGLTPR
ncbi:hypothetical protein GIY23_16695 [Allosaccharopolyspora coralli]|uniref:Uncharacterized protein n=1 Tax=Allosaccharopolyspora coralli TaxID=2665642 RepID=A0A5Q3QC46_9PSEU|nr:hypothetical protein [Allosaccharopolyspora coralli]QGK70936.1 hypothetical protein GIY23_16695 [Allosaccharopolyspora coralli]